MRDNTLRGIYFNMIPGGELVKKGEPIAEILLASPVSRGPALLPFGANELVTNGKRLFAVVNGINEEGSRDNTDFHGISLYPNPITGSKVYVEPGQIALKDSFITFYNSLGVAVWHHVIVEGIINELDVHELTSGVYFWAIHDADMIEYSGKTVVIR